MLRGGKGVSPGLVAVVALTATGLGYVLLDWWYGRGHALPEASWGAAVLVLFMAAGVFAAGLPVRRFRRGTNRRPLSPLRAMRTVVLAQAATLTGALVTGWYAAQLLVLLPDRDVDSVQAAMLRAGALSVCGLVLSVAGLLAQAMCRIDDD